MDAKDSTQRWTLGPGRRIIIRSPCTVTAVVENGKPVITVSPIELDVEYEKTAGSSEHIVVSDVSQ